MDHEHNDGEPEDNLPCQRDWGAIADDQIITRKDLCRMWGVAFNTLIRMEQAGELPLIKLSPRRVGYRMGTIRRLMVEREGK